MAESLASKNLLSYFREYEKVHQNAQNKLTHYFGIPLIVIGIFALLRKITLFNMGDASFSAAELLLVSASAWYLYLDWRISVPYILTLAGLDFLAVPMGVQTGFVLFVLGWAFQLVGHKFFEKKSPAFTDNFLHLLIGPLWIFARMVGYHR